jgi:hypothetical protein
VLKDCLAAAAAAGVDKVCLRSDSAGYQQDLLLYCGEGKDARFGVIEFAVSADVTEEFRKAARAVAEADWQPLYRRASVTRPTRSSPRSASCRPGPGTAGGVPASWRSANPCGTGRRRAVAVSHRGVRRQRSLQAVRHRHQPHAARRPSNLVAARTLRQERGGPCGHELAGCRAGCSEPTPRGS